MSRDYWGAVTPELVSQWISFDRDREDWCYRAEERSMPARQAEGVAGVWNKLGLYGAALLADEVGMGKTLQALGTLALLWKMNPKARVLVMAPNREICRLWEREYRKFVRNHWRTSDGILRTPSGQPVYEPLLCWRLSDLAEAVEAGTHQLLITTIFSLSSLVRGETDAGFDRLNGAAVAAREIHGRLMRALDGQGFDLVVVDEAHYFRNSEGTSQRAKAAREFFGCSGARLGRKTLLMTATPTHSSTDNVAAILGYATDIENETPEQLLTKFTLRRLRRMRGRGGTYDKYSYRNESAVEAVFHANPKAELFFALYQKLLVKQQAAERKRYLYGYLEGFESFEVTRHEDEADEEESGGKDFNGAVDTQVLKRLSAMHQAFGKDGLPDHPKYDALVENCVPKAVFNPSCDLYEHKHLVFVRRIASVREIAKRINAAYDVQLARRMVEAVCPEKLEETLDAWRKKGWSRKYFNDAVYQAPIEAEDDAALLTPDDELHQPDVETDRVYSKIADLFVVKKEGRERSTDCSNFSLRLRKPASLFALLLEPASDYRTGAYSYYYRKNVGGRVRDEYLSAARDERGVAGGREREHAQEERQRFDTPLRTLWGLVFAQLNPAEQSRIESWLAKDARIGENFSNYLKAGFLHASPVIVELYCWYAEFRRQGRQGDGAQKRYLSFLAFVEPRLAGSMSLAYFKAALETFEALCENITGYAVSDSSNSWSELFGLSSPAFYASGAVKHRDRLIMGFNSPFYPNVLAATSVLQEGVNLHIQCRKIHHYGIAWTPGDNEQRVGRLDRLFGRVNMQLEQYGKAELAIYYPYLAQSFDEEQLAAFIRAKHVVEARMDACRQLDLSTEIDIRNASVSWKNFLRKPNDSLSSPALADPFPFIEDERPVDDYRAWMAEDS